MAAPTALAQWTPSASGSTTAAAEINGKVNYQSGSGAPSVNCTAGKDLYFDLTNFQSYWCKATNTWAAFAGVVTSVFGRTAAVVAGSGDYTTAQVTESGNLYFTAGRAQAAMAGLYQTPISGAPGTWPTLGTAASHAASDFQAALTAYSTISGLSGYPSTFPAAITLTTSGSSGASTWNGTTLNIPQYSGGGGGGAPSPGITNHVYVSDGAGGWTDTGCTWNPSTGLVSCPSTNPLLVAGTCQAASAVSPPTSGVAAFCDSGNSNHLSVKPYGGSVVDLQATAGMSGVLKYASGSPSPIGTSSTDCVHPDGSSGACGSGGSGINVGPVVFDGATTSLVDGSTVAWTCGTGSGAQCTTSWTVPTGLNWVRVQMWGGGSGGGGSTAGSGSGSSGAGGGYQDMVCATTPGAAVSVAVGLGGIGSANWTAASGAGGNSTFGTCITVTGGAAGGTYYSPWGGRIYGAANVGWVIAAAVADSTQGYCRPGGSGMVATAPISTDQGGCGMQANDNLGWGCNASAGIAIGGGGGGGYGGWNNSCYGPGGTSALGGAGGHGGGWTSGGGLVACANGSIPGGGAGSAGAETAGGSNHAGCNGARGEVRVYFAK